MDDKDIRRRSGSLTRFARVFHALEYLLARSEGRTVTEVGRDLGWPTSSTYELLQLMTDARILRIDETRRYVLGDRFLRLAVRAADAFSIRRLARRHLVTLVEAVREDVYLALQLGHSVVYVDRYSGGQAVTVNIPLGQRLYLHSTAVGKLFAASDPDLEAIALTGDRRPALTRATIVDPHLLKREFAAIRRAQLSVSREESIDGVIGLAVPILNGQLNTIAAAIHVSAPQTRMPDHRIPVVARHMSETATLIAADLIGVTEPSAPDHELRRPKAQIARRLAR